MQPLDQPPARKSGPPWLWILGACWVVISVGFAIAIGSSFIKRAQVTAAEVEHPDEIGEAQRGFFLTPDELIAGGIWKPVTADPPPPKIKRMPGPAAYYVSTLLPFQGNPTVSQTAGIIDGPSWVAKLTMHQTMKLRQEKLGLEERELDTGRSELSAWRYCKADRCPMLVIVASGEQELIILSVAAEVKPEMDKLAASLQAELKRIDAYRQTRAESQ